MDPMAPDRGTDNVRRTVRLALLAVCVVLISVAAIGVARQVAHAQLEQRIVDLVGATPDGGTVRLGSAADAGWQRAYVFAAYYSVDLVNDTLGFAAFPPMEPAIIGMGDGEQLLVFVGDRRLVGYVTLSPAGFVVAPEALTMDDASMLASDPAHDSFTVTRTQGATELRPAP